MARLKGHQCEQQPQALRQANQDKTDGYCLDRQYVLPQAEFTDHQNVKTPEPKSDHRDAADTDHIGKDVSHGQLLRLPTDSQGNRRRARNSRQHENGSMKILYAFDLIELNGDDLRRDPLEVRKATLASIVAKAKPGIRFNEHMEGNGPTVFAHACKLGLEGIVSKRNDSPYRSGRSPHWLKMKNPAAPAVKREAEEDWG